ncbi:MAG: MFS transporter [Acidimicrobiales bacterium]
MQTSSATSPTTAASLGGLRILYVATLCYFTAFGVFYGAIQLYVKDELHADTTSVGLAMGAFSISALLVRPLVGRSIDIRGRRPFLLGALGILCVSSLGFLLANSVAIVIFLRLLQGAAGGAFYTTAAAMATDLAPSDRRAGAIARFSLFIYAGIAIGPSIAELVIDKAGFATLWFVPATLAAIGIACVWVLPESGTAAMAKRAELGAPIRRLLHPAAIAPGLVLMTTGMGYASITGFSSLYARHIGLESAGLLYAIFAVTVIGGRLISGPLADRKNRTTISLVGIILASIGLAILAGIQIPTAAFIGVAAFGSGFALIFPALMAFTVDRVDDHERGEAMGSFTAFMDIGTGGGAFLIGRLADNFGFGAAYGTPAVLCAIGAVLLVRLGRQHREASVAGSADIDDFPLPVD